MKTILTYGTFDLFHIGHVNLLKRTRALGDNLIVGLSTDEFNTVKGKKTIIPYNHRKTILESIRYVDKVIPEDTWEQKIDDIQRHNVSTFAMGDDWAGKFDFLQAHCEVVYLPRTKDISTTSLKEMLFTERESDRIALKNLLENALKIVSESL